MGKALAAFIKRFGRKPKDQLEWLQWRFKFAQESGKGQILRPDFNKKKPWHTTEKKADVIELDEPLVNEFAMPPHGYGAGHGTADPTQAQRIRQGFSTQSKLNSWSQNQRWVKDFIGRKNAEFNFLNKDDQKKVLDMFEVQIKKHMPKERKAGGGIAGMLGEPTYADDNHRVPYGGGGKTPSDVTEGGLLPRDFDDLSEEEKIHLMKLILSGEIPNLAEGGRVPFSKGKFGEWTAKGLAALIEKLFPGTTKIGQRSKPFPGKVQKTMDLRKSLADFKKREEAAKSKKLIDEDIKLIAKEQDLDEKSVRRIWDDHIADEGGIGSLDEFHADFVKETGINVSKDNLRKAWRMKRSYPFNTPIVDKTGKDIGGEATQKMYPESKKFIVKDSDTLTKEIEGKLPSGERAGIDVPHMPAGFKLSREKLEQNFPELGLDEIDEIMNLDKEMQGRVITMLKNRRLDPDLYDELLLKHGDTLNFQGEFDKAIRRKKNASGGLAGMLGE